MTELNERIAEEICLEPKPATFPDWEAAFCDTLNGHPIISDGGHWTCETRSENNDQMKWYPLDFARDPEAALRLIQQMQHVGRTISVQFKPLTVEVRVSDRHSDTIGSAGYGATLPEALVRAVEKIL